MAYRVVQAHISPDKKDDIDALREKDPVIDSWRVADGSARGSAIYSFLVRTKDTQELSDTLQSILGKDEAGKIIILPVAAVLPKIQENEAIENHKQAFSGISREELYDDIAQGADIGGTFVLLVIFSTIVAAIGLLENNVAVVVGAMVIAPLLGPNMALAFSTILGDKRLFIAALKCNAVGFTLCLLLSVLIGMIWPYGVDTHELELRTEVGISAIILALVSGAAGVLSLASGISGVLVGVMVAVALLPPAVTMGIMAGAGKMELALSAALLLATNIVCVNLAAKLVFMYKKVAPRTWYEKKKAKEKSHLALFFWIGSLLLIGLLIYLKKAV